MQLKIYSQKIAKPGKDIRIDLNSTQDSVVLLTAVDSSVDSLLSDKKSLKKILLNEFSSNSKLPKLKVENNQRYPSFSESNVMILTNALKGLTDCGSRVGKQMEEIFDDVHEVAEIESETRKFFPKTWLFESFHLENGHLSITRQIPDSITTWFLTGLTLHPSHGIGFASRRIRVVKEFFIQVEMPQSIVLGEIAQINVFVNNHQEDSSEFSAEIRLENKRNDFEIKNGKCDKVGGNIQVKNLTLDPNSVQIVSFFIQPTTIGDITILIKAISSIGNDTVEKTLQVKNEGVSHYIIQSRVIDMRRLQFHSYYMQSLINLDEVVPGSVEVVASATGNIMGSRFKLTGYRSGLVKFLYDLYYVEYLRAIKKLDEKKKLKLVESLSTGYQDFIQYRISDKSFGNVWMTALATKTLAHAKSWIEVDPQLVTDSLEFLEQRQTVEGGFQELNRNITSMELSAFTTIAFLENENYITRFKTTIVDAVKFIERNSNKILNNLDLALVAYALTLRGDINKDSYLNQLFRNSIIEDDEMHWQHEFTKKRSESLENISLKLQISSYALLSYLKADRKDEAIKVLRWLVKNKEVIFLYVD